MHKSNSSKNRLDQIDDEYQLLIIGGGVYGAALCWEAAHRGIKTLLIEKDDYASGASSNSLKTIHGGLRSLQTLNLKAALKGIRERSIFLRIAPNYVKPLPCTLPTTDSFMKSRPIVGLGLLVYKLLGQATKLIFRSESKIPVTRLLSVNEFKALAPLISCRNITGGAFWHDAQVTNTERLVWQFINSSINKGATAINHAEAVRYKGRNSEGSLSILVQDKITGNEKIIATETIIDASAAWNFIKHCLPEPRSDENLTFLKSVNIVVKKRIFETAVGINIKSAGNNTRLYFFAPWRDCTLIGTWYSSVKPYPDQHFSLSEAENCIEEINTAFKNNLFTVKDICNVHVGFLPASLNSIKNKTLDKSLLSRYQLKNWALQFDNQNIYSIRGTKYTLARHDAKQIIDQLINENKWKATASQSDKLPIYRGMSKEENTDLVPPCIMKKLVENYGEDTANILSYIKNNTQSLEAIPGTQYHINAEIQHAVFHEQALTLSDLLKRRLAIGDRAPPEHKTAQYCAKVMQQLLDWPDETMHAQITELYASYPDFLTQKNHPAAQP